MATYQSQEQSLTMNALEVISNKEHCKILSIPFEAGKIVEFREEFPEYFFYAQSGTIYAWQLVENPIQSLPTNFKEVTINKKDNTLVFNKVIESCFIQFFRARNRNITKVRNSSNWELELKTGGQDFNGFSTIPLLTFCFHPLYSVKSDRLVLGLSVRISARYKFTITEQEINLKRVDTRDWKRDEQGKITPFYANVLKYVQATNQHYNFKKHFDDINKESFAYEKLVFFHQQFNSTVKDSLILPDGLKIDNFASYNLSNSNFGSSIISKPKYYYYQDRTAKTFYNEAVKEQKPYSYDKFNGEPVNILVLTPIVHEGSSDEFIAKLKPVMVEMFPAVLAL